MGTKPHTYTISEAARELGLSAEWLRQGERRGSLPLARRGRNGYRYYTPEISCACATADCWSVMTSARITYSPREDVPPASELDTLAAVYAFILQCRADKKAAGTSGGEDDGKGVDHVPANASIP
jgi:hypothetical protein